MAEGGWEASCRGELMAGEKCRGELSPAGPWASACRTTDHMAGQRGHCRGETGWGSCRAELASGPRSHAMVESGLEPSYEDGVEFTEVSGSYLIWGGSRISKLANVSFCFLKANMILSHHHHCNPPVCTVWQCVCAWDLSLGGSVRLQMRWRAKAVQLCAPVQLWNCVHVHLCNCVQLWDCGIVELCATVQCTVCTPIESTRLDSELPGVCGVDNFFGSSFGFGKMTSALGFISRLECFNSCTLSALGPRVISYMCRKQFEGLSWQKIGLYGSFMTWEPLFPDIYTFLLLSPKLP